MDLWGGQRVKDSIARHVRPFPMHRVQANIEYDMLRYQTAADVGSHDIEHVLNSLD